MPGTHRALPIPYLSSPPGSYAAGTITRSLGRRLGCEVDLECALLVAGLQICKPESVSNAHITVSIPDMPSPRAGKASGSCASYGGSTHMCTYTCTHTLRHIGEKGRIYQQSSLHARPHSALPLAPEAAATEQGAGKRRLHDRLSALSPSPVPSTPDFRPLL